MRGEEKNWILKNNWKWVRGMKEDKVAGGERERERRWGGKSGGKREQNSGREIEKIMDWGVKDKDKKARRVEGDKKARCGRGDKKKQEKYKSEERETRDKKISRVRRKRDKNISGWVIIIGAGEMRKQMKKKKDKTKKKWEKPWNDKWANWEKSYMFLLNPKSLREFQELILFSIFFLLTSTQKPRPNFWLKIRHSWNSFKLCDTKYACD